jgi:hypothetical protein
MIELSQDKSDTGIKFQFDIKIKEQKIKKFILELTPLTKKAEIKRKMFWTPDFHRDYELFQLYDEL